jgi:DNA-binding NarL/FixJ family response regulator
MSGQGSQVKGLNLVQLCVHIGETESSVRRVEPMRVLVADDHSLFRDGIISLLEAAGFEVVGQAGDGQAAVEAALRLRPDLVLLDITMPQLSGLEALRLIKRELPETQVVMLTVSDDDADLFEAIESGALGYLLKNLSADQFFEMLDGLQRGEAAMTRQTTTRLMKGLAPAYPYG